MKKLNQCCWSQTNTQALWWLVALDYQGTTARFRQKLNEFSWKTSRREKAGDEWVYVEGVCMSLSYSWGFFVDWIFFGRKKNPWRADSSQECVHTPPVWEHESTSTLYFIDWKSKAQRTEMSYGDITGLLISGESRLEPQPSHPDPSPYWLWIAGFRFYSPTVLPGL